MSEPVTNVEIEDVLSSIRRLVSNTGREERPESDEAERDAGKLVLTPSLRVNEDSAPAEEKEAAYQSVDETDAAEDAPAEDSDFVFHSDDADAEAGQDISEPEPAEMADVAEADSINDDVIAEILEMQPEDQVDVEDDEPDRAFSTAGYEQENTDNTPQNAENAEDDGAPLELGSADVAHDAADDDTADDGADIQNNLHARAASFEKVVDERPDNWEPDGSSDHENAAMKVDPVPWADHDAEDRAEPEPVDEDETAEAGEEIEAETMTVKSFGAASDTADDADDAEEIAKEETGAAQQHLETDILSPDAPLAAEEALLDEDALRDMVSEIVRQELQGALGERITRNVRKLVRREIHRALASQELE